MHAAYASRYRSSCRLFSLSPYSVPPPAPTTPPMAAPWPAPLPPPAMAPPAAPRTAPATAPIPASLTVSTVLSRCPIWTAACWLHASMAACVGAAGAIGTAGGVAACGAVWAAGAAVVVDLTTEPDVRGAELVELEVVSAAFLSVSFPLQFATTRPVARAVAPTNIRASVVSFQGLFQPSFGMARGLLSSSRSDRAGQRLLSQTAVAEIRLVRAGTMPGGPEPQL